MLLSEVISELEAVARRLRGLGDLMEHSIEHSIPISDAFVGRELRSEAAKLRSTLILWEEADAAALESTVSGKFYDRKHLRELVSRHRAMIAHQAYL